MFITFEGVDGSGKTTQARRLTEYLKQAGHEVIYTREPGGTFIGDQIREVLLNNMENTDMNARTELLLFCASRAQLVAEVITPYLEGGGIVICDRYIDSTLAYQGYGHGLNLKTLRDVLSFATNSLLPDLTIYLEITPEAALKRRAEATLFGAEWNRLDDMDLEFHQRVYKGYRNLILAEPARFVEIDAVGNPEAVLGDILKALSSYLDIPKLPYANGHSKNGES